MLALTERVFSPQSTKSEKHGSGTDSDYDNTQTYDFSLRSARCEALLGNDDGAIYFCGGEIV